MTKQECSLNEIEKDQSQFYNLASFPKNVPEDNITGITIKGTNSDYLKGHEILMEMFVKKGDKFDIDGTEVMVADTPTNKPISIEVKEKNGRSGKANLKIYSKNAKGSATIMITKPSGGEICHLKTLAFKVVKVILDHVINGEEARVQCFKLKSSNKRDIKCTNCDESFSKCEHFD